MGLAAGDDLSGGGGGGDASSDAATPSAEPTDAAPDASASADAGDNNRAASLPISWSALPSVSQGGGPFKVTKIGASSGFWGGTATYVPPPWAPRSSSSSSEEATPTGADGGGSEGGGSSSDESSPSSTSDEAGPSPTGESSSESSATETSSESSAPGPATHGGSVGVGVGGVGSDTPSPKSPLPPPATHGGSVGVGVGGVGPSPGATPGWQTPTVPLTATSYPFLTEPVVTTNAIGLTYTLNWFSVYTTTTCNEIDGGLHGDQPLRFCSGYTTTDPHAEAYPFYPGATDEIERTKDCPYTNYESPLCPWFSFTRSTQYSGNVHDGLTTACALTSSYAGAAWRPIPHPHITELGVVGASAYLMVCQTYSETNSAGEALPTNGPFAAAPTPAMTHLTSSSTAAPAAAIETPVSTAKPASSPSAASSPTAAASSVAPVSSAAPGTTATPPSAPSAAAPTTTTSKPKKKCPAKKRR